MTAGNTIQLKVCGMRDPENVIRIASLQPDYMGFIFFEKSPRFVGHDFVIPAGFPDNITRVGVFVNEQVDVIVEKAGRLGLTHIQLHGDETPGQAEALKKQGYVVMKVFSIDDTFDFSTTVPFKGVADYFLFDTKGKFYGGNARRFNWDILKQYDQQVPFFLSGGLNEENIHEVEQLKGMNLYAVDVNSGVELSPALKDEHKVGALQKYLEGLRLSG